MLRPALIAALILPLAVPLPAIAADGQFVAEATAICRETLAARNYVAHRDEASLSGSALLAAIRGTEAPSAGTVRQLADSLAIVRDDLAAALDRLRVLVPSDPALVEPFAAYIAYGDREIAVADARLALVATWREGVVPWPRENELGIPDHTGTPINDAIALLGFSDRECRHLFGSLGYPPPDAAFIAAVAPICAAIADRRNTADFAAWSNASIAALAAVIQDRPPEPDAVPALRALAAEWQQTVADFAAIDPAAARNPTLWTAWLDLARERADRLSARADAIAAGYPEAIDAAFDRISGMPEFEALGLRETSCMALTRGL